MFHDALQYLLVSKKKVKANFQNLPTSSCGTACPAAFLSRLPAALPSVVFFDMHNSLERAAFGAMGPVALASRPAP
jgi:hypothetical protein